jgi:hypothetical protein
MKKIFQKNGNRILQHGKGNYPIDCKRRSGRINKREKGGELSSLAKPDNSPRPDPFLTKERRYRKGKY